MIQRERHGERPHLRHVFIRPGGEVDLVLWGDGVGEVGEGIAEGLRGPLHPLPADLLDSDASSSLLSHGRNLGRLGCEL